MVSKSEKVMERATQYSDIINSIFHANRLFYFFMFINHSSYCLLYHLFHVFMSIKILQMTLPPMDDYIFWPPKIKSYDLAGNRSSLWFFTKLLIFCQNVELPSAILWNTSQYSRALLSIVAGHMLIFLQNTFQHFCKTHFTISAEHISVFLKRFLSDFHNTF